MLKNKTTLFALILPILLLSGCQVNNGPVGSGNYQMVGGEAIHASGPIVGNKYDEKSVIEPVKEIVKTQLGKEIPNFQSGEFIRFQENLFFNYDFKIENKQYYGFAHAFIKDNGWVITEKEYIPVNTQFPVMCSVSRFSPSYFQKNGNVNSQSLLFYGYINDDRVRFIQFTFESGNKNILNISKGQKSYIFWYTRLDQFKSFTAYDENWKVIHQQ